MAYNFRKKPVIHVNPAHVATLVDSKGAVDVQFSLEALRDILICDICEGYFKDATTIKECLHTFCESCLLLRLAQGKDDCMKCGTKFGGGIIADAIQRDVIIQNLVDKLFPQFAKAEDESYADLCRFLEIEVDRPATSTITEPNNGPKHLRLEHAKEKYLNTVLYPCNKSYLLWSGTVGIVLQHAEQSFFLRVSPKIAVKCLIAFLISKLKLQENFDAVELYLENKFVPHSHTIEFVYRSRRMDVTKKSLLFEYRFP